MNRASLYLLTRDQKRRRDRTSFDALVDGPASGAVTLPANGRFAFVATADCEAGTPVATITGPTTYDIESREMVAGESLVVDALELGTVVTVHQGFDLYVLDGLNVGNKICEGAA